MNTLLVRHGLSEADMVTNILRTWRRSTSAERAGGSNWYSEARDHAAGIGDLVGAGLQVGAAALAVLSPQVEWTVNVREAYAVACDVADGILSDDNSYAAFPINVGKAYTVLSDPATLDETVSGPKVSAFYRAIAGLPGGPVVDRHATRVATAHRFDTVTRATYRAVSAAYVRAAAILGHDEHALQATCWLVCKRDLMATRKHGADTDPDHEAVPCADARCGHCHGLEY
jgi:hypothetical protein